MFCRPKTRAPSHPKPPLAIKPSPPQPLAAMLRRLHLQQLGLQRRVALSSRHVSSTTPSPPSTTRLQYLSLYNYTQIDELALPKLRKHMAERWRALQVMGRIYIAQEGINAQLILPAQNVDAFATSFPELFSHQQLNYGALYEGDDAHERSRQLFEKLDIRIRKQIVADGFEKGHLNLQDSGLALSPDEWHAKLQQRNQCSHEEEATTNKTLVLDVRNFYEHEIGRFDGATRIMVDTFRDTFDALDEILASQNEPPQEVMMYCTGGIRCEKVGAYLKQHKNIHAVHKLQGGIVNYQKFLETNPQTQSLFKGKNFVFDQRCVDNSKGVNSAETVTPDVLGQCFQCGEPCNDHTNCSNLMCHGLILQCASCAAQFHGACSPRCHDEVELMASMTPEQQREHRKQHAHLWRPQNPNAPTASEVKFVTFRPVSPTMKHRAA